MSKAIEANSKFFDQLASTYSSEVIRYVSQEVADYILKDQAAHINADSSILDYACGGGDISLTFKPLVKSVSGADVSAGMLENFTKRAALTDQGSAHTFLIKDGKLPEQAGPFDLIICTHAYHHFEDPKGVTNMLVQHLKPNGTLLVADFPRTELPPRPAHGQPQDISTADPRVPPEHVVPHHFGFDKDELESIFKEAGLRNVQIKRDMSLSKSKARAMQGSEMLGHMLDAEGGDDFTYLMATGHK